MSAKYDISIFQGETFNLHLLYLDTSDSSIDIPSTAYSARLQVRRSSDAKSILLDLTSSPYGCTAGITGSGVLDTSCTGGIKLNRNMGDTGDQTGGMYVFAGATAMGYVPAGRHFYDLQISATGETSQLIHGRFECDGEITR